MPLLGPVVAELLDYGLPRAGWVVTLGVKPYPVERLSVDSHWHLRGLGVETTLHSMRHAFLTNAANVTHDPLFVRDLAGHGSVATTEIYMDTNMLGAHERLAGVASIASDVLGAHRLHVA